MSLLEVNRLSVCFELGRGRRLHAVDDVSLAVARGESVGLVGESGCGKSTLGNTVLRLAPASSGGVMFDGRDVLALRGAALQQFRRRAQMIFQDPYGSLNPRLSIGAALDEVLRVHRLGRRLERQARIRELLEIVGLDPAYAGRYPHEFSGGQRQRIGIARALALNPELVIADEPVSALDVSVQVQILNLMKDLQKSRTLAYLFIAHDLAVVHYMCDRILVMYFGRIVESGPADDVFLRPLHPYTQALLEAVPDVDKGLQRRRQHAARVVLKGEVPSASTAVAGCSFHPRCRYAQERCRIESPDLREIKPGHASRCYFAEAIVKYRS